MLYIVKTCHIQCPPVPQSPVCTHWREHTQHTLCHDRWLRVSREFKPHQRLPLFFLTRIFAVIALYYYLVATTNLSGILTIELDHINISLHRESYGREAVMSYWCSH